MLKPVLTTAAFLSLLVAARAEGANPALGAPMATAQFIWLGNGVQIIDHLRQPGEVAASFKVESKPVPEGTQLVFELIALTESEPAVRWRCVTEINTAECFPEPIMVGFRPKDSAIRLQVQLVDPSGDIDGPLQLALGR